MSLSEAVALLAGACLGSFIDVVAHRTVQGRPWWGMERSACETCGRTLTALELIPVLSWIIQRGRCRSCGARIPVRCLVVEALCSAGAFLIVRRWGVSPVCALYMVGLAAAMVSSLTDCESGDVFDVFSIAAAFAGLFIRVLQGGSHFIDGLMGAAAGWGVFALVILLSRGGMGWGDASFMCGMGAVLGWRAALLSVYVGIMLGGLTAILLIAMGRVRLGRGDSMPLVPFLAAGCLCSMLWGEEILLNILNINININININV